jgi:hypothetical protein
VSASTCGRFGTETTAVERPHGLDGWHLLEGIEGIDGMEGLEGMQGIEGIEGMQGIAGPAALYACISVEFHVKPHRAA